MRNTYINEKNSTVYEVKEGRGHVRLIIHDAEQGYVSIGLLNVLNPKGIGYTKNINESDKKKISKEIDSISWIDEVEKHFLKNVLI